MRHRQHGITLIELVIVLAIFAIASAALWSYASNVIGQRKINQLNEQMLQLVQNVKSLYANLQNADSLNNTMVINARLAPSDMLDPATTGGLRHVFGGAVMLSTMPGTDIGVAQFAGVPASVCTQLIITYLGKDLKTFTQAGLYGLSVNNATPLWSVLDPTSLPPPLTAVEDACGQSTTASIYIFFRLGS